MNGTSNFQNVHIVTKHRHAQIYEKQITVGENSEVKYRQRHIKRIYFLREIVAYVLPILPGC